MANYQLPHPMTNGDQFLAAIHAELVTLNTLLSSLLATEEPAGDVEAPSLPAGFPGKAELEAAGITSIDEIPRTAKRLKEIPGVGPATSTAILKAVGKQVEIDGL